MSRPARAWGSGGRWPPSEAGGPGGGGHLGAPGFKNKIRGRVALPPWRVLFPSTRPNSFDGARPRRLSRVSPRLTPQTSVSDALRRCFSGGGVRGGSAPRKSAVEALGRRACEICGQRLQRPLTTATKAPPRTWSAAQSGLGQARAHG
eukprot:13348925-Alexandrium_andersonii.AAC.1